MTRSLPRRTSLAIAHVTALCVVLAACGSQLDPEEVAAGTRGTVGAGTVGGVAAGSGSIDTDGDGVGDVTVAEPGDPGVPDGGAPAGGSTDTGSGTSTTGDGADGGSGTAAGSAGGGGGGGPQSPTTQAASGGGRAGSCDGFENSTGITDSSITIANASDISGAVPGLFEASRQGTQAFVAYYNATEKLCGRSLKLMPLDSRGDAGGDQQAYAKACDDAFAVVGSTSAFDSGGAATAQACGLPDLRGFTVTPERQKCSTCFAAYTIDSDQIASTVPDFWLKKEPEASKHVAIFYVNVAAARTNAESFAAVYEKAGMKVPVVQGIDTGEFNFAPYVQQMKDNDIQFVQYFGPYQFTIKLQQAMAQQQFTPKVFLQDPTIYDANYVKQAGSLAKGVYVYSPIQLFDNTRIPEMALYRSWLERIKPGAVPNYYGLFAWSAARLFVQQATALGGALDRKTLVSSLTRVKDWTGNGLHAPMAVGGRTTSPCIKYFQYSGSAWSQVSPGDFMCGRLITR